MTPQLTTRTLRIELSAHRYDKWPVTNLPAVGQDKWPATTSLTPRDKWPATTSLTPRPITQD